MISLNLYLKITTLATESKSYVGTQRKIKEHLSTYRIITKNTRYSYSLKEEYICIQSSYDWRWSTHTN